MAEERVFVKRHDREQWLRAKRMRAAREMFDGLDRIIHDNEDENAVQIAAKGLVDLIETIESEVKL